MESSRCPVVYKKLILMPTTWRKARRLVKESKGIFVKDKVLGVYLKLKYNPIGPNDIPNENQTLVLGIDPGSMFDGFTVISKLDQRNFQFNHQLSISKSLKSIMDKKKGYRRIRRSRLRHRKAKFESRTGNKITNTSNYYYQNRVNIINRLINLYPIKLIAIEDVKFSHYHSNKGKSFSNIEIGKNRLYNFIKSKGLYLYKFRGRETKDIREMIFRTRLKNKDKSIRNFDSHCIDSFTIGVIGLVNYTSDYRVYTQFMNNKVNTLVRFIDRVTYKYRRELHRLKNKIRDSRFYFRYKRGGIKTYIDHYSKLKKLRVKVNDDKSNHGPWNYLYTKPELTYKKFITNYGGTIGKNGISKYWNDNYYQYYNISVA